MQPQQIGTGIRPPTQQDWSQAGYSDLEQQVLDQYQGRYDADVGVYFNKSEKAREDIARVGEGVRTTQASFNKYSADANYHYNKYKERKSRYKDRWPFKPKGLRKSYRESRRLGAKYTNKAKSLSMLPYAPTQETFEYKPMMLEAMANKFLPGSSQQAGATGGIAQGQRFDPIHLSEWDTDLRLAELERKKAYTGLIDAQTESQTGYNKAMTDLSKAQAGLTYR